MNIVGKLEIIANQNPDKTIFIDKKDETTYQAFIDKAAAIENNLVKMGVKSGDNILVLQPISVTLYTLLTAIWAVGASVVLFDPSAGKVHIENCLKTVKVNVFIGCGKALLLRQFVKPLRDIPRHCSVTELCSSQIVYKLNTAPTSPDYPALITFTSGSTNIPKAIVRTHDFLLSQYDAIVNNMDYKSSDIDLAVLPVFTLVNMAAGVTTVIPDDSLSDIAKVNVKKLVRQIIKHKITRITASPKLIEAICQYATDNNIHFHHIRRANVGGGPVYLSTLEVMEKVIAKQNIHIAYGSTEAEPISDISYGSLAEDDITGMKTGKGLIVGNIVNEIELKIIENRSGIPINEDVRTLETSIGEIIVSGKHVVKGYYNSEFNADNKIHNGDTVWHRTGDAGYLDEKGHLWLLGRISQVIDDNGNDLYPFAIESAICNKYQIKRCAIISFHNLKWLILENGTEKIATVSHEFSSTFDKIVSIKKIPLDKRHRSKIDYHALKVLLDHFPQSR